MRIRILILMFLAAFAAVGWGQTMATPVRVDPNSHNRCNVYDAPEPFRWTVMATRPVDIPIVDYATLVKFLAPSNADDVRDLNQPARFDKPWQQQAKAGWRWTDQELNNMWFASQQGENSNWRREFIKPCAILGDMMYGTQTALVGRPTLVDFSDNGPREAWVFPIRDDLEAVFFKDCSNPSYRVRIPQHAEQVVATPPPPPPAPAQPDQCPNILGLQLAIPPGMTLDTAGSCVLMQQPAAQAPIVIPQQGRPANQTAAALTYINVNAQPQPAAYQPPLTTVSRSAAQFPSVITVKVEATVRHVQACEGKACPGWTYGFRNFGQGLGAIGTGAGLAYMPFALKSGMIRSAQAQADGAVRAAEARRPDVITISGVNSPTFNNAFDPSFNPTFNPTNTNNNTPTFTNNPNITPTFNGPTYTPPVYTPPTYTPVYTPPTYTPPVYPPVTINNPPPVVPVCPVNTFPYEGGCKPNGTPPPRP